MLCSEDSSKDTWEVVSDVASVHSFSSHMLDTYAEIAKMPSLLPKPSASIQGGAKEGISADNQETKRTQDKRENKDEAFDSFFIMEGIKEARGGKSSLMFKGNLKTQKPRKKARKKFRKTST